MFIISNTIYVLTVLSLTVILAIYTEAVEALKKGDAFFASKKFEEAEALLTTLCIDQPNNPINWLNRAACLRSMKVMGKCTWTLKQGLRWNPGYPDTCA